MTPEGKVKAKISAMLKKYGVWYYMPIQRGYSRAGVPDYLCCIGGHMFTIEAKAGKAKPRQSQELEMQRLQKAGAVTLVVNEDALVALDGWLGEMVSTAGKANNYGEPRFT